MQVHADFATASDIEIATSCVINAVLRGKHISLGPLAPPAPSTPLEAPRTPTPTVTGGVAGAKLVGGGGGAGGGMNEVGGCLFETALTLALRQHEAFPHPVSNVWAGGVMVLLHEWMVNRGELGGAEG